jgi:hypothetical protein
MLKKFILALSVLAAFTAGSAFAQDNSANHQLATAVARKLSGSGKLNQYQLDIIVNGTTVELTGTVSDMAQIVEADRLAHEVPGIKMVSNKLSIRGTIRQSAAQEQIPSPTQAPGMGAPASPCSLGLEKCDVELRRWLLVPQQPCRQPRLVASSLLVTS